MASYRAKRPSTAPRTRTLATAAAALAGAGIAASTLLGPGNSSLESTQLDVSTQQPATTTSDAVAHSTPRNTASGDTRTETGHLSHGQPAPHTRATPEPAPARATPQPDRTPEHSAPAPTPATSPKPTTTSSDTPEPRPHQFTVVASGYQGEIDACIGMIDYGGRGQLFAEHNYCGGNRYHELQVGSTVELTGTHSGTYTVTEIWDSYAGAPWDVLGNDPHLQTSLTGGAVRLWRLAPAP